MISQDRANNIRKKAHAHLKTDAGNQAINAGLGKPAAEVLAAAVKPPLVGFLDDFAVHFLPPDATTVANVTGDRPGVDAAPTRTTVDRRVWSGVLDQLTAAGYTVSLTAAEGDPAED